LLLKKLLQEQMYRPERGWWLFLIRIALASVSMSACLYYFIDAD
jgi:putative peptidoglycan lipid II flippase